MKQKFYFQVKPVRHISTGKVTAIRPGPVTMSQPQEPKGLVLELNFDIEDSLFEPLKLGSTITVTSSATDPPRVTAEPGSPWEASLKKEGLT